MARERGPSKLDNPWPRIGWWSTAGLLAVALILGFIVLGREQQNGPTLGTWNAILLVMMVVTYGYPIGQFFFLKSHSVPAVQVTSQESAPTGVR